MCLFNSSYEVSHQCVVIHFLGAYACGMWCARWSLCPIPAFSVKRTHFSLDVSAELPKELKLELDRLRKQTQLSAEIIYGIQPALAALSANQRSISKLFIRDDILKLSPAQLLSKNTAFSTIVNLASSKNLHMNGVPRAFMAALTNGRSNQGVAALCSPMPVASLQGVSTTTLLHFLNCRFPRNASICCGSSSMVLFLDQIQDVMNLGSIFRTAVFFGIPTVCFSAFFSATPSPLISKLSAGAMEHIRFFRVAHTTTMLKRLSRAGFLVVGTAGKQPGHAENFDHSPPIDLFEVKPSMVSHYLVTFS